MNLNNQEPFMLGVASDLALPPVESQLMLAAGIRWLRCGKFGLNQEKFFRGESQGPEFARAKERIRELRVLGFRFMGLTPEPRSVSPAAGVPGSPVYLSNYRRLCRFLAEEFQDLIQWWQVGNELDIWIFRADLSLEQSVEFLKEGIRGIKEAEGKLKTGINITLFPSLPGEVDGNTDRHEGVFLAKAVYGDPSLELDYAGFDSYPGTWRKGGVESWDGYLDAFYQLTQKPIIVQEFGYSSAGDMMTTEEDLSGVYPCKAKKWRFSWQGAHTPEVQARFVGETLAVFARKPFVIGATYYCWRDSLRCWQCGDENCPAETAWGLLDRSGRPKPSYYSYQAAARFLEPTVI